MSANQAQFSRIDSQKTTGETHLCRFPPWSHPFPSKGPEFADLSIARAPLPRRRFPGGPRGEVLGPLGQGHSRLDLAGRGYSSRLSHSLPMSGMGVRRAKAAPFQWLQVPPGDRSRHRRPSGRFARGRRTVRGPRPRRDRPARTALPRVMAFRPVSPRSPSFPLVGASLNREIAAAAAELQFLTISYAYYERGLQIRCNLAEINIRLRR